MEIVDPCDNPVSISFNGAPVDQEYTISQSFYEYVVPACTVEPSWCSITYSYEITSIAGDSALTFDASTRTFTFSEDSDITLSGPTFTDYTVKVFGTSGNVLSSSAEESFNLRLKNPCIDSAFFSLSSVALPVGETYTLFTT